MDKRTQKLMFSNKSDHWSTPQALYYELNEEFNFDFDPCPLHHNIDLQDGLRVKWGLSNFVNPPYSNIRAFLEKAISEIKTGNAKVCVFLIPSRTDTKWFHELIYQKYEIRFIKGRLKFGGQKNAAPFPSMLVIIK